MVIMDKHLNSSYSYCNEQDESGMLGYACALPFHDRKGLRLMLCMVILGIIDLM